MRKLGVLDALTYYRASAGDPPRCGQLSTDMDVDVAIIGAGFTGLSAAIELAAAGVRTAVVEAGPLGWGASGRTGGQICTSYSPGMAKFVSALGREGAQAAFDISEEGKRLITQRAEAYGFDCEIKWGYLICANKPAHMDELKAYIDELESFGYGGCELLPKERLESDYLGTRIYHGGLRDPGAGHLHPLKYVHGLAAAALKEGARIFIHTPVRALEQGKKIRLRCDAGTLMADRLILATNAYIDGLYPPISRRIMPVASYIIATEPLGKERARELIRHDEAVADENFVVDYFRLSADHRLLFGGRCSYSGWHPQNLAAYMRPRMLKVYPQLADVAIEHAWGGHIGITFNRLPDAGITGEAGNIWHAQGYSGHGVALSGMMGKLMAGSILGTDERFELFARIPHMPFPGGVLARPAHTLGMLYYRARDLLG